MLSHKTKSFENRHTERAHLDRPDEGHVKLIPKVRIRIRTEWPLEIVMELVKGTMPVGEITVHRLQKRGTDIGRINYQRNGTQDVSRPDGWYFCFHPYVQAKSTSIQKYSDVLFLLRRETGFHIKVAPLNLDDCEAIRREVARFLMTMRCKSL